LFSALAGMLFGELRNVSIFEVLETEGEKASKIATS
jgi:hypothetical protein